MAPFVDYLRFGPATRLASKVRQRVIPDAVLLWLLATFMNYSSARKSRRRQKLDPKFWRSAWEGGDLAGWPRLPIPGILTIGNVQLVIDRSDITADGHIWVDGWTTAPGRASLKLAAQGCKVLWQSTFLTPRRDVAEALKLSVSGSEADLGFQILGRIADYSPETSRLALRTEDTSGDYGFIIPVVARLERSGSLWHSLYETMRHRGPRRVEYLETSVKVLKELRKTDWRERAREVRQEIEAQMPAGPALKILLLSRHHPNGAYVNLHQLASALDEPADFMVCSIGQQATQRANEYRPHFSTLHDHTVRLLTAETGTPSSEIIEQFAASCQRRGAPGLIVNDDVAIADAARSVKQAYQEMADGTRSRPVIWRRQSPKFAAADMPFIRPPSSRGGLGPYWLMAMDFKNGAVGAVLFHPARWRLPDIPPFEGRGYALEYLARTALPEATVSPEAMLDLVDSAGQGEPMTLDRLLLIAD